VDDGACDAEDLGMVTAFEEMIELAKRVGITVRHARLGGGGGGMALIKGQRVLFVDVDAEPLDQLEQTARGLAGLKEVSEVFVRPDVREILEKWGRAGG
jgi:hypothetical protein